MKKKPNKQYEDEPEQDQSLTVGSYSSSSKTGTTKTRQIGFIRKKRKAKGK